MSSDATRRSEYPTFFMKNNPWSQIKSEKDFRAMMIRVEAKAWHQENVWRKKIGLPVLKKRKT